MIIQYIALLAIAIFLARWMFRKYHEMVGMTREIVDEEMEEARKGSKPDIKSIAGKTILKFMEKKNGNGSKAEEKASGDKEE